MPFDHDYLALIEARRDTLLRALSSARTKYKKDVLQSALWELSIAGNVIARLYDEEAQEPAWLAAGYGPRAEQR